MGIVDKVTSAYHSLFANLSQHSMDGKLILAYF